MAIKGSLKLPAGAKAANAHKAPRPPITPGNFGSKRDGGAPAAAKNRPKARPPAGKPGRGTTGALKTPGQAGRSAAKPPTLGPMGGPFV